MTRSFKTPCAVDVSVAGMTPRDTDDIPYFPAPAPEVFSDPVATRALVAAALHDLEAVVQLEDPSLAAPTPCPDFTVALLRDHVLGWLQHFAAAMSDPDRRSTRPDPDAYRAAADERPPQQVVADSARRIEAALADDVLTRQVVMSTSRMDGPAVAGMLLGEYLVHGWDLARATGRPWGPDPVACAAALGFFRGIVTAEYRGPEGFFGAEVPVAQDAGQLDRLLGFVGRDPGWRPPA